MGSLSLKDRGLLAQFGGGSTAVEPRPKAIEGEWSEAGNVIIEFADTAFFDRMYSSNEYRPLLDLRRSAA